jgi:predicted nucleic acid-binding protein
LSCYLDTSVLFSLYVPDANTPAAVSRTRSATRPLLCSDFAEFEFVNALSLRLFRRELSMSQVREVLDLFRQDLESGALRSSRIPSTAFQRARDIAHQHTPMLGTRSLDILHIAAATAVGATQFITFDKRQAKLASVLGLRLP